MRSFAVAAVTAALALTSAVTTSAAAQTTAHRASTSTAAAAAKRRAAAAATAKPAAGAASTSSEGLAAVGTMPAAAGTSQTLFALRYVDLKVGTGELALPRKFYTVQYTGWTTDGKKFDSSYDHDGGQAFTFPVGARRVITGWDTGFEGMHIGGKRRMVIPYQLAYGAEGRPPVIPAKADLIFDIELLSQSDTPPQQPAPAPAPAAQQPAKPENKPAQQPGTNPVTDPKNQTDVPATAKPQK